MSSVSTKSTIQDVQFLNFPFQDNYSQYNDTYRNALVGHQQQSIHNPNQQNILLIAKGSNEQENQIMRLENIIAHLGIEYTINNESILLNISLFEKWKEKIEEMLFYSLPIQESLIL